MARIETRVGKEFEVSLKANPATGYRWEPHFDSKRISLIERRYKSKQKKTGGAGLEIFTFEALETGSAEIEMILKRPWEESFLNKEIFEIAVK